MISGSTLLIPLLTTRDITSFGFVWATKYPLQCLHLINPIGSYRIHVCYTIYANIGGILMVNVTIDSSTMDPMGIGANLSPQSDTSRRLRLLAPQQLLWARLPRPWLAGLQARRRRRGRGAHRVFDRSIRRGCHQGPGTAGKESMVTRSWHRGVRPFCHGVPPSIRVMTMTFSIESHRFFGVFPH